MRRLCILALSCLALASACSDSGSDSNNDMPLIDAGVDGGGDAGDVGDDAGPGGCAVQADCADDQICQDATCIAAPECSGLNDWKTCVEAFEAIEPGLGRRAACGGTHCRVTCLIDQDCADGQVCTNNGECVDFGGEITGEAPGGDARAELKAGVGNVLMNFPIGLSQGGYGSRSATNDGRYVESLESTDGEMHGLYARAVVLDNGERKLMFVRLPIIFPSMALHEAVARRLQELTGKDWRDSLVVTGTHTHSGPTRYWQLPDDAALPLGSFGTDEFSQQVFDWTVDSTFEAAKAALEDESAAQFGWEIVEGFDTDDRVSSDRWGETPPFDDNRLLIFRVDDADGNPRAVMVSYGTHGTIHDKSYFTSDAPGGAERGLERALAKEYDRFVPVMYLNENGGSMSPRGDHWGHRSAERFEELGWELSQRAMPAIRDMEMHTDIELDAVTHRFPITYEMLGYEEGEWQVGTIGKGSPHDEYDFGGLQCISSVGDDDPATHVEPPVSDCLPLHFLNHHRPVTLFAKSQMTALNVDGLTIITLPGESTMEMGWQVLKEARDQFGVDPLDAWVWGYAQDHQFYLTPSNLRGGMPPFPGMSVPKAPDEYPDYAFSWRQGGYEASMSVWGWKFGDYLVDRAMETVSLLEGQTPESPLPPALPTEYERVDENPFPVEASDAATVGEVVEDVPATVSRLEPIEFAWIGGDPGAEMPQAPRVWLQLESGGDFLSFNTRNKRPYTNREPVMLTRMRKDGDDWQWVVHWEEIQNFPAAEYRFLVEGHYQDENGERQSYEATSQTFELVASDALEVTTDVSGTTLTGTLGYPAGHALKYEFEADDPGKVTGSFRMRHPKVPLGESAPLVPDEDVSADGVIVHVMDGSTEVDTLTGADVTLTTTDETVGGRDGVPVTHYEVDLSGVASGSYDLDVEVTDAYGNTGSTTTSASF